jgi:hypothetical protein
MSTTKVAETVGKAIPNEFSKMSSWLRYVPYVGPMMQTLGAVDSAATTYADMRQSDDPEMRKKAALVAFMRGFDSFSGGNDPGAMGSQGHVNQDWANTLGQVGRIFPQAPRGMSSFYG